MARQLPIIFGQGDYLQKLGTSDRTIAEVGCYNVVFSTLARACGKETDPVELNKILTERNLYLNGNLMYDNNLTKVFPDIVYQKTIEFPGETPADIELLRELMKDPMTWVVIKIQVPPPVNTHFVLCTGVNGVIKIADPLTKKQHDFAERYGDPQRNIMKFVVYKGAPVLAEQVDDSIRLERDRNWNIAQEVVSALGVEVTPNDKDGMVTRAKEKINSYISQISDYTGKLREFQKKTDDLQNDIISLKDEITRIHQEDKDYVSETLDAQHNAQSVKELIHMISDAVNLQYDPTDDKATVEKILDEIHKLQAGSIQEPSTDIPHLQAIAKHFVSMGINQYLQSRGFEPIDPTNIDSRFTEKITMYLTDLTNELLQLNAKRPVLETTPTVSETIQSPRQPVLKKFFITVISLFVDVK